MTRNNQVVAGSCLSLQLITTKMLIIKHAQTRKCSEFSSEPHWKHQRHTVIECHTQVDHIKKNHTATTTQHTTHKFCAIQLDRIHTSTITITKTHTVNTANTPDHGYTLGARRFSFGCLVSFLVTPALGFFKRLFWVFTLDLGGKNRLLFLPTCACLWQKRFHSKRPPKTANKCEWHQTNPIYMYIYVWMYVSTRQHSNTRMH